MLHQPEMFEGLDHGYGPNPHDIGGQQHWVVDENGIPVRADLTLESRNLETPCREICGVMNWLLSMSERVSL